MVIGSSPARWYVAQLKPNSHRIALGHLERQGFVAFVPMHATTERLRGAFRTRSKPLFPGYVFLQFDPAAAGWSKINATRGVTRLICSGAVPRPVPEGVMQALLARADAAGSGTTEAVFDPGDTVAVTQGPFADFVATVEKMSADERVWVLLELMGRETRVAVPAAQLRAAGSGT